MTSGGFYQTAARAATGHPHGSPDGAPAHRPAQPQSLSALPFTTCPQIAHTLVLLPVAALRPSA